MHSTWTSGARPSVAGTLTWKQCFRLHQNTSFSFKKLKQFLAREHSPSPDSTPAGGIPLSHPPPSAPTASPLSRLRRSTRGFLAKILNTPLLCSLARVLRYHTAEIINALITCEMKLFQNYFTLRWRSSETILFQRVETCLKLFQNYFTGFLQLMNIFQHRCRWNNLRTPSAGEIILFQFQTWLHVK